MDLFAIIWSEGTSRITWSKMIHPLPTPFISHRGQLSFPVCAFIQYICKKKMSNFSFANTVWHISNYKEMYHLLVYIIEGSTSKRVEYPLAGQTARKTKGALVNFPPNFPLYLNSQRKILEIWYCVKGEKLDTRPLVFSYRLIYYIFIVYRVRICLASLGYPSKKTHRY